MKLIKKNWAIICIDKPIKNVAYVLLVCNSIVRHAKCSNSRELDLRIHLRWCDYLIANSALVVNQTLVIDFKWKYSIISKINDTTKTEEEKLWTDDID